MLGYNNRAERPHRRRATSHSDDSRDAGVQAFPRRPVCLRLDAPPHLRLLAYRTCLPRSGGLSRVNSTAERNLIGRKMAGTSLYRSGLCIKWVDGTICPKTLKWRNRKTTSGCLFFFLHKMSKWQTEAKVYSLGSLGKSMQCIAKHASQNPVHC